MISIGCGSRSRSPSRKRAYDQVKIENRSRRNQNVSISSDSVYDSVAYDPVKTCLSESEADGEEPTNRKVENRTMPWVSFSASACGSDNAVFT